MREVEGALQLFGPRGRPKEELRTLGRFDDEEVNAFLDIVRFGLSPGSLEALHRMNKEFDVRHVLPAVRVPTLILHGSEDTILPLEVSRYMASHIPSVRVVEIPGAGHLALGRPLVAIAGEIERFVKDGKQAAGRSESLTAFSPPFCSLTSSARRRRLSSSQALRPGPASRIPDRRATALPACRSTLSV